MLVELLLATGVNVAVNGAASAAGPLLFIADARSEPG
jgi:hypothetical protein